MGRFDSKRKIASEITITETNRTEKLTYIGSGMNCIAYHTGSENIIKEFAPLIKIDNEYVNVMERKNGPNSELVPMDDLSSFYLDLIAERRMAFDSEIAIIEELNRRYHSDRDNMFLIPQDVDTTLGRCQWCNYVGGQTLETVFAESRKKSAGNFQQHFLNVLPFIISLYDEIALYHGECDESHYGILNLDVKPENLFAIKSQGDYIGIRNLDFGSARIIEDEKKGEDVVRPGLITQIREFASKHNYSMLTLSDERIDQIATKFFISSPGFYDRDRVSAIIRKCLDSGKSNESIISDLKTLDILAAWKTFLFALSESGDAFVTGNISNIDEKNSLYREFSDIFEENRLTKHHSLFESYNIYTYLYEIMARTLDGGVRYRLSASEIANRLRNVFCIFSGVPDNKKTAEQQRFEDMNRIYSRKDGLLKSHGIENIKDILEFCKANGLHEHELPGDLHWFLICGKKHS